MGDMRQHLQDHDYCINEEIHSIHDELDIKCEEIKCEPEDETVCDFEDIDNEYVDVDSHDQGLIKSEVFDFDEDPLNIQSEKIVVQKHPCFQCPQEFFSSISLIEHEEVVHGVVNQSKTPNVRDKFECNLCGYKFTRQYNLKQHIEAVHEGRKFPCQLCDKQFTQQSRLNYHMRAAHTGCKYSQPNQTVVQKYPCFECREKFSNPTSLAEHVGKVHQRTENYRR